MKNGKTILALTDSVGHVNEQLNPHFVYPFLVQKKIEDTYPGTKIHLVNKGIGGATTTRIKNMLDDKWYIRLEYFDLAIIGLGLNDCASQSVPVATYTSNLESIITSLRNLSPDCELILMSPTATNMADRVAYVDAYRTAMAGVVANHPNDGIYYADGSLAYTVEELSTFCTEVGGAPGSYIHPKDNGQQRILDNVLWPVILQTDLIDSLA